MKSITILNRIKSTERCSINDTNLLTRALHREGKLDTDKAVRFKVLLAEFDIVNADFEKLDAPLISYEDLGKFENVYNRFK